jgi:hypothetical protein
MPNCLSDFIQMTKQTDLFGKIAFMEVVEGRRARLEAEIVEDLFLGRYDPAKVAGLARRGQLRLVACPSQEKADTPRDPKIAAPV